VARVSVSDRGPGLSPFDQEHVWERFYQAVDVRAQSGLGMGLGLGLYVCRMIIEQHDGHVGVESAMGNGSTFWFTLPLATMDATKDATGDA
jgi:signal transduction histidine kinase